MNTNDNTSLHQLKVTPDSNQADALLLIPSNMTLSAIFNGIAETFRYLVENLSYRVYKREFATSIQKSTESRSIHALIARGTVNWDEDLNVEFTIDINGKKAILFNKILNWSINLLISLLLIIALIDHTFLHHFQSANFTKFISSISRYQIINEIIFYFLLLSFIAFLVLITLYDINQTKMISKIIFKGKVLMNNSDTHTVVSEDYEYIVKFSNQERIAKVVPELNYLYCFYLLFLNNFEFSGIYLIYWFLIFNYFLSSKFTPLIFLVGLVLFLYWIIDELISKRIQTIKKELNIQLPINDSSETAL